MLNEPTGCRHFASMTLEARGNICREGETGGVTIFSPEGILVPEQKGQRAVQPGPVVIRKELDGDKIMVSLANSFPSWDYRQGSYY
jgi:hypothetical protein